jgi:tRNA (cmo5U34)-methyltransferase
MPVPTSFNRNAQATVPGYDALHDLGGCLLRSLLKKEARILVVGAGSGQEVFSLGRHGKKWSFAAVEPSYDMRQRARGRMLVEGVDSRGVAIFADITKIEDKRFDAATMILMLHLLETRDAQLELLREVAKRLKRGAPLLVALPCTDLDDEDLFVRAWHRRLQTQGVTAADVERDLAIESTITTPANAEQVKLLLEEAGFEKPRLYFASLFFKAWVLHRA